jgi:hypothetical protein
MAIKNVVGAVVPADDQQKQAEAKTKEIVEWMRTWGVMLDPAERNTFLKPKLGGDRMVELMLEFIEKYSLNIASVPPAELENDLAVARAAERFERELAVAHQLACDTRIAAWGEVWQAFLAYYGVLSSMASRDAALATQLAPITEFMARRRTKPARGTETAASTTPSKATEVRPG